MKKSPKTIDEIFEEGVMVDESLRKGVQDALLRHKQMGSPVVAWPMER